MLILGKLMMSSFYARYEMNNVNGIGYFCCFMFTRILTWLSFSLFLGLLSEPVFAQPGHWQEFRGKRVFGRDDSRSRLEKLLLEEARRKVIEQEVGIRVQTTEQNVKGEYISRTQGPSAQSRALWVEDFISLSKQESSGRIVQEDEPQFSESTMGGERYLELFYRAKVARDQGKRDPGFRVLFEMSQDSYREGDTIRMKASSDRPCWLYVFNVGRDGQFSLIWPNIYDRDNALVPGRTRNLPTDENRYDLVAELNQSPVQNDGQNEPGASSPLSHETQTDLIFALFYLGERQLLEPETFKQGKEFTLGDFNRLLLEIDLRDRREAAVAYTTTRRK